MLRGGHAGNRFAMLDMPRDQGARQRAHADLVAAIPDRDGLPRPGAEEIVERRGISADVEPSHIAWGAIGAPPATLDRNGMGDSGQPPPVDRFSYIGGVDRHISRPGPAQRSGACAAARLIGGEPAWDTDLL